MHAKSNALPNQPGTSEQVRLLADAMLGRLARWLRLMGYDTLYDSALSDHQLVARARSQQRTILTRDRELARRKGIGCLLVQSQMLEEQIKEVLDALGPPTCGAEPRCPLCNAPLMSVSSQEIALRVPAYVRQAHTRFRRCADCDKVYWQGSHWQKIRQVTEHLLDRRAR
jgi:uncharacterized protein with PIN domain